MTTDLSLRPSKIKPGLINMKYQAIVFGKQFGKRDTRFMDRMAEMMNLSDGKRTVGQIARILGYELGPIEPGLVAEMFAALEEHGYIVQAGKAG